jgi:hypothetical protein
MGKSKTNNFDLKSFTNQTLLDRNLIIRMLKYEDTLILGKIGKNIYTNATYQVSESLFSEYVVHRIVLDHFGFDTTDQSVLNYRNIFKTYYRSPFDYDKEVLQSVSYMRENKCVYYTEPDINLGDVLSDCKLKTLEGDDTSITESLGKFKLAFIAGFSDS